MSGWVSRWREAVVFALAAAVYLNSLHGKFVFDDSPGQYAVGTGESRGERES
jgi:hypothetical protein